MPNDGANNEPLVDGTPTPTANEGNDGGNNQKTFTQEDIQNSFNAGVKKASSEWQKDEKYKDFLNWKKSSQSESEKLTELETTNKTLFNENSYLKAQIEISTSDVKKDFTKFVTNEVLSMVNETTDLKTALTSFKKENPQYFGETVVKKVQSSPTLNGGGTQPQTTNSIMNDMLRNARN